MKKILVVFFIIVITNICFSAKAIDLPKHYKFPKNYFKGKHYDSVKDFFLIATKKIRDSRFEKTVILMLEHDKKGALGIVINKRKALLNYFGGLQEINNASIDELQKVVGINHKLATKIQETLKRLLVLWYFIYL